MGYAPPLDRAAGFTPVSFGGGLAEAAEARRLKRKAEYAGAGIEEEDGLVRLYEPIGALFGVSAADFGAAVDAQRGDFTLAISSAGGSLFDGLAMGNTLRRYDRGRVTAEIDGLAASAATLVAAGADRIAARSDARVLVHQAQVIAGGRAEELAKFAAEARSLDESMARLYAWRSGGKLDAEAAAALMREDRHLSAAEALELGLVDEVICGGPPPEPEAADGAGLREARARFDAFLDDFPAPRRAA